MAMQKMGIAAGAKRFFRLDFAGELGRMRQSFTESTRSLKTTRTLAAVGMLLAMQIVLGFVATVSVGQFIRITFDFLPVAVAGMLFGPVPAMLCSGLADIIMCILRPMGPYFPGFTVTALLGGLVYGVAFYRRDVDLVHIVLAKLTVNLVVNTLINSVNLMILYGNVTFPILIQRTVTNLIKLPADVILLSIVLVTAQSIYKRLRWA